MRGGASLILGLFLLLFQGLLYHLGVPSWFIPQGLLVCAVFLAFHECTWWGAVCAFILGLLVDMSSGVVLGPWAGAYTLVYLFLTVISQRLFVQSMLVSMSAVAFSAVLGGGVFLLLAYEYQSLSSEDFVTLLGQGIASACATPPIFAVLGRVWKRAGALSSKRNSVLSAV